MEIANIVSTSKINVGPEFNVVDTVDDIVFKDLPTLIIGYDVVCDIYGEENVNILNRNVGKNVFWTLDRKIKRQTYASDIEDFIRHSYKKSINKINFVDLDLIQSQPNKIRKIVKKMLSLKNPISFETENNVIYVYADNIIFGVDLNLVKYVGFDVEKVRKKIKDKSVVFLEGSEILIEYNSYLERLDNDIKLVPFLYSINPHE